MMMWPLWPNYSSSSSATGASSAKPSIPTTSPTLKLNAITDDVVEAARSTLVIGLTRPAKPSCEIPPNEAASHRHSGDGWRHIVPHGCTQEKHSNL